MGLDVVSRLSLSGGWLNPTYKPGNPSSSKKENAFAWVVLRHAGGMAAAKLEHDYDPIS